MSLNFIAQALALAGCGSLALATTLHIASNARFFLIPPFGILAILCIAAGARHPAIIAFGGSAAVLLAFALIFRGLRKSNVFYQPRRMFGVTVGQPMAVR